MKESHNEKCLPKNDIAVIGMSCRFPGDVMNPQTFWNLLMTGGNGIVDIPSDRWENAAYYDADKTKHNKMYVNRGGFIKNIDQFDPQFFGISPKEAPYIDPQHRWLLELVYEAFENAGVKSSELKGSNTAVYIGQFMHDYEQLQLDRSSHKMITTHSATGPSMTLTANRISYAFDFIGPSVTLDTACSSSLVALDMACKALLNGDSRLAIAGGVNILLRPELTMSICKASMLSPDCHCKSFDASANGYVRSEGAGILLVKKLEDAIADGDPVLAVIKATGVNQDGQTIGITVPNGESQKKLLVQSLQRAQLTPGDIQYAEAHGTGTAVGDPIEVNALGQILGQRDSSQEPCIIGSVKSNIGHTEAAAGIAGVIKTILAINESIIPKNIHLNTINPAINTEQLNIKLAQQQQPWPMTKIKRALVNSFGFGGTNANVILEQAPNIFSAGSDQKPVINGSIKLLPISAKSEAGLKAQAERYLKYLSTVAEEDLHHICYTASVKREHFKYRLVINGKNKSELTQALQDYIDNKPSTNYLSAAAQSTLSEKIAFVFSGMGPQWIGMGKALYQSEPVFQHTMNQCSQALEKYSGWSLIDAIYNTNDDSVFNATYIAQPAIFAIQLSLAKLLQSWDIHPDCIVGHSAGEVAAACFAGALEFDDAIKVIFHRSQLQHTTEGMGKMLAVGLSLTELNPYLLGVEHKISVAAINSEKALTLAGDADVLTDIAQRLDAQGLFARFLNVGIPYHSPVMDQLKIPLINILQGIKVNNPSIPLYSTVSGDLTKENNWGPEYWADNVREPVLFKTAIDKIATQNIGAFIELAPNAALASSIVKNLEQLSIKSLVVTTLKRQQDDELMLHNTIATLHVGGMNLNWKSFYPNKGRLMSLPNYPWQHTRYWCESEESQRARLKNLHHSGGFTEPVHPLLGSRFNSSKLIWQKNLDLQELSYLIGHQVENDIVYPGAAYVEMALSVAKIQYPFDSISLENIEFKRAVFLDKTKTRVLETEFDKANNIFEISTLDSISDEWISVSSATINHFSTTDSKKIINLSEIQSKFSQAYSKPEFYEHCAKLGLTYKDEFQPVDIAWYTESESLVSVKLPDNLLNTMDAYWLHPVLLDGAFQALFPTVSQGYLPVSIAQLNYYQKPSTSFYCYLTTSYRDELQMRGDLILFNENGDLFVEVLGCELKALQVNDSNLQNSLLYNFKWQEQTLTKPSQPTSHGEWLIFADKKGIAKKLAKVMQSHSIPVCLIEKAEVLKQLGDRHYAVPENVNDIANLLKVYAKTAQGLVYLWGLDSIADDDISAESIFDLCQDTIINPLFLAQALDQIEWQQQPIYLVSQAAQFISRDATIQPVQAALWGFSRVFASEYPEHNISLIDIPLEINDALIKQLLDELLNTEYEQEIALRTQGRYVNRLNLLNKDDLNEYTQQLIVSKNDQAFEVITPDKANPGKTVLRAIELAKLPRTHIAIQVEYLSKTEQSHQDGAIFSSVPTGIECVGTIVGLGAEVQDFSIGEKVLAFTKSTLSSIIHVDKLLVTRITSNINSEQVCTLASSFLKAEYCLNYLSNLESNKTILIHEATSSVGLAAIQLAKQKNAKIYATAKNRHDREFLNQFDLMGIFDSNSHAFFKTFSDQLVADGNGIDLVLNTLEGHYVDKTLNLMNRFGNFIELNIQPATLTRRQITLLSNRNISYHSLNIVELAESQPEFFGKMLANVVQMVSQGYITPLPVTILKLDEIDELPNDAEITSQFNKMVIEIQQGTRFLQQGLHKQVIRTECSYLVTGGLGGLGLEMMHWLSEQGAKSIVLTGRSQPSQYALTQIENVRRTGISVTTIQADISNTADVARTLDLIKTNLFPLAGIIHSAGVLDDGTIAQQTVEKFNKVMAPKIKGAWNLHKLTKDIELDFFICFSSIASIVGWAGQSNYAAANAFMDSLAFYRRIQGMPSLTINWGPWSGSGMAANLDERDKQRMQEAGMTALTVNKGLNAMSNLLSHRIPQAGVFELNWTNLGKLYNSKKKTLLRNFIQDNQESNTTDLLGMLKSSTSIERELILKNYTCELLADVLGIENPNSIDHEIAVFDYGMNSLMAMDFKNRLQTSLKLKLPGTMVSKHPTINAMVNYINTLVDSAIEENIAVSEDILLWDPNQPNQINNFEINGSLPFTLSVLHWFKQGVLNNFNICFLIEFESNTFDIDVLKTTMKILFTYHDGCRLQIYRENDTFRQEIIALDDIVIHKHDYSDLVYEDAVIRMQEQNDHYQKSFTFTKGDPLFKIAYYRINDTKPHRLLLIFHHFLTDGLSQKIILSDLADIYMKVFNKQAVYKNPKNYSLIGHQLLSEANRHTYPLS